MIARTFLFSYFRDKYGITNFEFSYGDKKRPFLKSIDMDFNISYSKDLIAIAISKGEIGVDIEFIDHSFDIKNTALMFMNDNEIKTFNSLDKREKYDYFFYLWTYKEALVKLLGHGLYLDLKKITDFETNGLSINKYKPFISKEYHLCVTKYT